jgi:hypothetical protein
LAATFTGQEWTRVWSMSKRQGWLPPHLADAGDVESWARQQVEARTDFPRLIRRLIRQTKDQVVKLEMRAGKGAGYRGYDGRVEATKATPFVPEGQSVWELGVGESPRTKANREYKKRTAKPLGVDRSQTTFVFTTARRWAGKSSWEQEKQAEGKWRDVKAFDADDIETTLESAPAAHIWLSELLDKPAAGIRTIEGWWERFSQTTNPALTERLVLAGRADEASELLRVLAEDGHITTIAAASTDDVLAFVASVLGSAPEPERTDLLSKTLIVSDALSLQWLEKAAEPLTILPIGDDLRREAQLVRSHHVLLPVPRDVPGDIVLRSIDRQAFSAELKSTGLLEDASLRLANVAHRSIVAFQRDAAAYGTAPRDWNGLMRSKAIRRAWLAGSWHEGRSGDTDALAAAIGVAYEDARTELEVCSTGEDPLFTIIGGAWSLASAEEAWHYGIAQVSTLDLDAAEAMVQTVLGAINPALELPVAERWMAGVYGKVRVHSSDLRSGLATTLALAGTYGAPRRLGAVGTVAGWAAKVVAQLLRRANEDSSGQLWASLSDVLPLLAEASPDVFLKAVEVGVSGNQPVLATMFTDSDSSYFVSSPHTGLLWALERVAWSSDHAALSARLLARLAEIDPGGKLSNRPLGTLVTIFRPWFPQTSLGPQRRLNVIDGLRRNHEAVSWTLMIQLLERHVIGHHTNSPSFRAWKPETKRVTAMEFWEVSSALAQRLIEAAGTSTDRWLEVVEHLPDFPPPQRAQAQEQLAGIAASDKLKGPERKQLWAAVDELVRQHRTFAGADWALPEDDVNRLAAIADSLAPPDPVEANRWLFDEHFPDLGKGREDHEIRTADVEAARVAAIAQILDGHGIGALLDLARLVKYPGMAGVSAAARATVELDEWVVSLLDDSDHRLVDFAAGYSWERVRTAGWPWVTERLDTFAGRSAVQARLLLRSDDVQAAWQKAAGLGSDVEAAYWKDFSNLGHGSEFGLVNEAAENLMRHGRPLAAIDLLALYANPGQTLVSLELALQGLETVVTLPAGHDEAYRVSAYDLERLMDYVRSVPGVDDERLGKLEWALLPAMGFRARSPVLHRRLARDPAFFVEIVSLCYKPRKAKQQTQVPHEIAANAHDLLREWKIVPGSTEPNGEVDGAQLSQWVTTAQQLLLEADRREVGEIHIGHVFAHSRSDADGSWPTRPVREVIESNDSTYFADGLATQTRNNRGVTSRALSEGGDQERQLAAHYDKLASLVRDQWSKTAAVLSSIARNYEQEALWHDEQAERFQQGLDH